MSVCEKLSCSLSRTIAKHQLTSQRQCTFVTAAVVQLVPHTRDVFYKIICKAWILVSQLYNSIVFFTDSVCGCLLFLQSLL